MSDPGSSPDGGILHCHASHCECGASRLSWQTALPNYKLLRGLVLSEQQRPRGPMDKASAHGAGDCRFESCRGHFQSLTKCSRSVVRGSRFRVCVSAAALLRYRSAPARDLHSFAQARANSQAQGSSPTSGNIVIWRMPGCRCASCRCAARTESSAQGSWLFGLVV